MTEKQQFDQLLGGSEKLPRDAHTLKLAAARASEIAAMTHSLENPQQTKLIFQKLPIHMRRRVMSHNAKRLPRKLRNAHINQLKKSGLPPKAKRPSRKYRRRPQNLLSEYSRRQRNKFWLETHIWHAKRFKMIDKWGFKIANHSNDRCFRASYRAVTQHCLIQDISYYTCLEITGPTNILEENLKRHCNPHGLTFAAKAFSTGEREGTLMFYKKDAYPFHPIGNIHFLWKSNDTGIRAIWIWAHPAFYNSLLNEIVLSFNFDLESVSNVETESEGSQEKMNSQEKNEVAQELRIFLTEKIPFYKNTNGCQLLVLRNCLNRFRLSGPLAISVLADVLRTPCINSKLDSDQVMEQNQITIEAEEETKSCQEKSTVNECKEWKMQVDTDTDDYKLDHSIDSWFKTYYQFQENVDAFNAQNDVFNRLNKSRCQDQLPPNTVVALTVLDPRFFLPQVRTKSLVNPGVAETACCSTYPTSIKDSPLWNSDIRKYVTKNCMSMAAFNSVRSQNLVPGVDNDQFYNEDTMHKIPILLIAKPGNYTHNGSIGFGAGIDIVLPSSWSLPFWLACILRCARPGGLRESKLIAYEGCNLNTPATNDPDTEAYEVEASLVKQELTDKYFRLPPNKRVNYVKFAISSPFYCEWKLLMKEWNDKESFYVLRDGQILSNLNRYLCFESMKKNVEKTQKKSNDNNLSMEFDNLLENKNCLIPVKVSIERNGVPENFSIICLATQEDLTKFNEDKNWSGPVESPKQDSNEEKRKTLRNGHKAHLKQLRKRRISAKKLMETANSDAPVEECSDKDDLSRIHQIVKDKLTDMNRTLINQQAQTMASLYLPKCKAVRYSCDRQVIGYVDLGGFSFSKAKGVGLGYVVFSSMVELIKQKSNIVLVRNTTTRKYRLCRLEILY